jgi:macrolide transport system ATP-binding/permease protein
VNVARSVWSGLFGWLKHRRLDDEDFQDEIRSHLAIATDERVAGGAERRDAHLAALKDFGNVTLTTEAARSVWKTRWIEAARDWLNDVGHAVRVLAKTPAFSLTVVAVLTLGIGLNAAVFTLLKSLALTPLAGVERSASLSVVLSETRAGRRASLSYPDYRYLRDHDRAFAGLIGSANTSVSLGSGNRAEWIRGELVTGNYFQELGVRAQLGRTLLPSDEVAPGQHPVVVLSDSLWKRHFGSDPGIVGKTIRLNTHSLTVVGVAAPSFHGTIVSFDGEVFIPVMMAPQIEPGGSGTRDPRTVLSDKHASFLIVQGFLRPGTTRAEAAAQMAILSTRLRGDAAIDAAAQELKVVPIWQSPFGAQTYMLPAVMVLSAMGALLLLIVCASVAGLVLARGVSRRGEIALRLALGASRSRILRLLLVESFVLAVPGALMALALVSRVLEMVKSAAVTAAPMRLFFNLSVDPLVVGFSLLAALASALVFGWLPALRSSRVDLLSVMKDDFSPRSAARGRLRAGLVISQVAVSLLLLIGAGLVTRSVDAARNADMGFDATSVASMRLDLRPHGYDDTRGGAFFKQLLENVRADTGIESATLASNTPLTMVDSGARKVTIDGYDPHRDEDLTFLSNVVAPDYFRTLKIGLLAGREFESRDDAMALPAVIVNETLARRFWGGAADAIGKRIRVSAGEWRTVIGVVRDIKYSRINEGPRPYVYLPFLQTYQSSVVLHVRGSIGVATLIEEVRARIQALDPDLPILSAGALSEQTRWAFSILEMAARVLFIIGVAGMTLAAMGIYGLVAYIVRQSTHEIGIRMALGAAGGDVVWHFLRRGLRLGAIGAAVGTIAALAMTRLLGSVLFGISATDPISFAGALAVVLGAVIVATLIPAWRAARTSPLAALRQT